MNLRTFKVIKKSMADGAESEHAFALACSNPQESDWAIGSLD